MKSFLKKLESENFRLRFLNFSEIDSWSSLDNYTRIKSFIVDGVFEISCSKWYAMYIQIVECLQKIKPQDLNFLLDLSSFTGRCTPFLDHSAGGYVETDFGLYLRVPSAANDVIFFIKHILKIYNFDAKDAYLVVELNPESASYYSDDIIEQEKNDLLCFLKKTFVNSEQYYNTAIDAIRALNESLQYFTPTKYNNLYLLSEDDYCRYSREAIDKQLSRTNNTFTERELTLAVEWLNYARFYENDYICVTHKNHSGSFIKIGEKLIQVLFKTHFFNGRNVQDE